MIYIVTGTPGTGKTTYAKDFSKEKGIKYFCGKEIIKEHNLSEGFDEVDQCDIIDEQKFAKVCAEIIKESKEDLIIDSHLSHYISPELIDVCYVTECDIAELKIRLEERKYSDKKVRDNLDSEIFRVCEMDATENGHSVIVIDTSSK